MHGGRGPVRLLTPRIGKKWWHSCIPNRLQERRLVWALKREIAALEDDFSTQYENARNEGQQEEAVMAWHHESERPEAELGKIETNKLLRRAERRGLDLYDEQSWWTDHPNHQTEARFLTYSGRGKAKRLIRNDFRQSAMWWIMALTGLGGTVIGILSLLNSNR